MSTHTCGVGELARRIDHDDDPGHTGEASYHAPASGPTSAHAHPGKESAIPRYRPTWRVKPSLKMKESSNAWRSSPPVPHRACPDMPPDARPFPPEAQLLTHVSTPPPCCVDSIGVGYIAQRVLPSTHASPHARAQLLRRSRCAVLCICRVQPCEAGTHM